jgi:putative DNA modification/repair radical SAM protein
MEKPVDRKLPEKLRILSDAAKYDASCASSSAPKRVAGKGGLGSSSNGICHAFTPDGRCVSLLKILLTNFCLFDCAYCINRRSSNVERARFSVDEVVSLTLGFYKRNYIEGLFLSSGIIRSPDYTMEQMMLVAKKLRQEHGFAGYIHLKTIPEANPWLIEQAGLWADRLSINIELSSDASLQRLAPEKKGDMITAAMGQIQERIGEAREEHRHFSPAGQSTQIIVGADDTTDASLLKTSDTLYKSYELRRVYYSAFSPIPAASTILPLKPPPLLRENRLYQADWLLRYYGFTVEEIASGGENGMLDLQADPKLAWVLKNRHLFPLDVNTAVREMLLRIPGLGVRAVDKIVAARRHTKLRIGDIARLSSGVKRMLPFIITIDHRPGRLSERADLRQYLVAPSRQLGLFP